MSYQVLARKYRPQNFESLVGQEHVVRALTHALTQQRLHHAYLFTGTRGVGKTTLSRILAKSLNCEKGITAQPCGNCQACVAIDAGRFVDYIEMDAASNRGVEEMANLLEQAIYAPTNARFKVYMIDEVHMLTNHAFNAMLKTLEEPPPHIKFILATTDPQKIPVTVLSRCLQFNLKQMPPVHIVSHLQSILQQEQIDFDTPALHLIAKGAQGSMRDALSLTDQAIAYSAGNVSLDSVQSMLGTVDQTYLYQILDALVKQDGLSLIQIADQMALRSLSYAFALQDLAIILNHISIAQLVPEALAEELPQREHLLQLAQQLTKEDVQLYYQIAVHGRQDLGLAPDEYAGFTMTLLRMLAFSPSDVHLNSQPNSSSHFASAEKKSPVKLKNANETVPQAVSSEHIGAQSQPQPKFEEPHAIVSTTLAMPSVISSTTAPTVQLSQPQQTTQLPQSSTPTNAPISQALAAARALSAKYMNKNGGGGASLMSQPQTQPHIQATASYQPTLTQAPTETLISDELASQTDFKSEAMPPDYFFNEEAIFQGASLQTQAQPQHASQSVANATQDKHRPASERVDKSNTVSQSPPTHTIPEVVKPMPPIGWDGHWPSLMLSLSLKGLPQQLALQSQLVDCREENKIILFSLRLPIANLASQSTCDAFLMTLNDKFADTGYVCRIENIAIGEVYHTGNALMAEKQAALQKQAEEAILQDSFVQKLIQTFDAKVILESIKPI